jgi:hypothetical protein
VNDTATRVTSTRALDAADHLPWDGWGDSHRIVAETDTMAATDDMVPIAEVRAQGARPTDVPTALEETWGRMTR